MDFSVPESLEVEISELISRYPHKRSAVLMVLHALQEHFGWLSPAAMEWTAQRLGLQPIHVLELVSFYPMFRRAPAGRFQLKVCRTLSCALAGSHRLHEHLCRRLGLDPRKRGLQTTPDGQFSVEFVECQASCHTAPVLLCNDQLHEHMTFAKADALLESCR